MDTFMETYDKKMAEVGLPGAAAAGKRGPQGSWCGSRAGVGLQPVLVTRRLDFLFPCRVWVTCLGDT